VILQGYVGLNSIAQSSNYYENQKVLREALTWIEAKFASGIYTPFDEKYELRQGRKNCDIEIVHSWDQRDYPQSGYRNSVKFIFNLGDLAGAGSPDNQEGEVRKMYLLASGNMSSIRIVGDSENPLTHGHVDRRSTLLALELKDEDSILTRMATAFSDAVEACGGGLKDEKY